MPRTTTARPILAPAAVFAALLAACSPATSTQLVVVIDSDYEPGVEIERVEIQTRDEMGSPVDSRSVTVGPGALRFPFSFAVVPRGGDASRSILLEVRGFVGADEIVKRDVATGFVAGQARVLRIHLSRACATTRCLPDLTCERGACIDPLVAPETLPVYVPGHELDPEMDAGTPMDAGPIDAEPSDAPSDAIAPDDDAPDASGPGCSVGSERVVFFETGGSPVVVGASSSEVGIVRLDTSGAFFVPVDLAGAPGASRSFLVGDGYDSGSIAWRGTGWVTALRRGSDGRVDVGTFPSIGGTTDTQSGLGDADGPPSAVGDVRTVLVAYRTTGTLAPTVRVDHEAGTGSDGPVPVDPSESAVPPAAAWSETAGPVVAYVAGPNLDIREITPGPPTGPTGSLYTTMLTADAQTVAVDVSARRLAAIVWFGPIRPATLATFVTGFPALIGAVDVEPGGFPIRSPAAIAVDDETLGIAVRTHGLVHGTDVWFRYVRENDSVVDVEVDTTPDDVVAGPWVFHVTSGWLVLYVTREIMREVVAGRVVTCR